MYIYDVLATTTTPTWITNADFSGITDVANSVAEKVGPAIIAVMAVTIGIRLFKKLANKIG